MRRVCCQQGGNCGWTIWGRAEAVSAWAADTFLELPGGVEGVVWIEGVKLGRC